MVREDSKREVSMFENENNTTESYIDRRLIQCKSIRCTSNLNLKLKECMSDSVTNYNYVGDTKVSVSIKKTNANKCTLSEIFLSEILKSW